MQVANQATFPRIDLFLDPEVWDDFKKIPNNGLTYPEYKMFENSTGVRGVLKEKPIGGQSFVKQKVISDIGIFLGAKVAPAYLIDNPIEGKNTARAFCRSVWETDRYNFFCLYGGKIPEHYKGVGKNADHDLAFKKNVLGVNAVLVALCGLRDTDLDKSVFFTQGTNEPYQIDFGFTSHNIDKSDFLPYWKGSNKDFLCFSKEYLGQFSLPSILFYLERCLDLPELSDSDIHQMLELGEVIIQMFGILTKKYTFVELNNFREKQKIPKTSMNDIKLLSYPR